MPTTLDDILNRAIQTAARQAGSAVDQNGEEKPAFQEARKNVFAAQNGPAPIVERAAAPLTSQPIPTTVPAATAPQTTGSPDSVQSVTKTQEQSSVQSTTPKAPQSYAEMFVAMNPYRPQTPEERAEEARRNKRNALFAAISDGISALSNLYYTTKGAPNSFNGGSTLSGKMYERQRQLEKDREARDKDYLNGYLRALEMDRNNDNTERNYRMQMEQLIYNRKRQAEADKRAEAKDARDAAKAERDAKMDELKYKYQQGQLDKQEYDKKAAEIKAKYAEAYERARIASLNRRNSGSGSGGVKFIPITTPDGKKAYNLPENVIKNSKLLEGALKAADINIYSGYGNKKKKDTKELWGEVLASPRGQEYLDNVAKWSGGSVWGNTDFDNDDPYADYEIEQPESGSDGEFDYETTRM